jgi:sugar transferase EpsL
MTRDLYRRFGKRLVDVVGSSLCLVVLSPFLTCVAAAVRIRLGSPVLFAQRRPGRNGAIFVMRKFRTMTDARDMHGNLLPDEERLTALGLFLRSTSLDELPELWNVLTGDMSLVGPRPLLVRYLDRYTPDQMRRHDVRPGITGWAQVHGRNALTWQTKFALDVWYADNVSMSLDLRILGLTLARILTRDGVSHDGHATMPEFLDEP